MGVGAPGGRALLSALPAGAGPDRRAGRACLWGLVLSFAAASVAAAAEEVTLTLGDGWGVVREVRTVELKAGEQEIVFGEIPAEADLSTLAIRSRRVSVDLLSWAWVEEGAQAQRVADEDGLVTMGRADGAARWTPGESAPVPGMQTLRRVRCVIRSSGAGRRPLELLYRVDGVSWSCHYQALVRGELAEEREALAVDFAGAARIQNGTARGFADVLVRLVGPGRLPEPGRDPGPGYLMMDEDHPLADLWRSAEPEVGPEYEYRPVRRVTLVARAATEVPLAGAERVPAAPLYAMRSEDVPLAARGAGTPLTKMIVFKNAVRHGLGSALPPGPVDVFLGGMRRQMLEGAAIPFTAADGEIRIALGSDPGVRGRRRAVAHTEAAQGSYEAVYEIVVDNERDSPVVVEISEKPPPILEWNLLSSTAACTERAQRLFFRQTVAAGSFSTIQYTLRVRRPSL